MTGFPRANRSFYFDDMGVTFGDVVKCKCPGPDSAFTAGWWYRVGLGQTLQDNDGTYTRPSGRFTYA